MTLYRFTIFDLLLLMFASAIGIVWYQTTPETNFPFDDLFFRYSTPRVPAEYADGSRPVPPKSLSVDGATRFRNGHDLYLSNHFADWKAVAIKFTNDRPYWDEVYEIQPVVEALPMERWTNSHVLCARCDGQAAAINRVNGLLLQYGEPELRRQMATVPWYRYYLEFLWPTMLTGIFLLVVGWRFCRLSTSTKKTKSQN